MMGQLKDPNLREKYDTSELISLLDKYDVLQLKLDQINANLRESTFELGENESEIDLQKMEKETLIK
jgi:hypothetical protein